MSKTPKGEINIRDRDGWIQLRWRHQGKRYSLGMGLRYDPINLEVAKQRASQIRLDMLAGNFDSTLKKYKSESSSGNELGAVALFEAFIEWKAKRVQARTMEKYHGLVTWLSEYFGDRLLFQAR